MILYPTETIYGLGVNALDSQALERLFLLKGRETEKAVSWLVRDLADIERYAEVSEVAAKIATQFLPGSLTLVLPAKADVPSTVVADDRTVSFRITTDQVAQKLIADFMTKHDAPLTCTSANVSGQAPETSPDLILKQFQRVGKDVGVIDQVIDDGSRTGEPSTVVKIINDQVEILREGAIPGEDLLKSVVV